MCGVESTRGPSAPRKVMAMSVVTRSLRSPLAPIGMVAIIRNGRSGTGDRLRRGQAGQNTAHIAHGAQRAGEWILPVDLVFQVHAALEIHFLELLEDGRERHDAFAAVALAGDGLVARGAVLKEAQILDVQLEEALAGEGNALDNIDAGTGGVADIDAEADERVHIPDHFQDRLRRGEILLFGAVVVDGEPDFIFLCKFFHGLDTRAGGNAYSLGKTQILDVFEALANIVGVVFRKGEIAHAHDFEAGGVELGPRLLEHFGCSREGEVDAILDANPGRLDRLEHFDALGAVEAAERVGGDTELDAPRLRLNLGGSWGDSGSA